MRLNNTALYVLIGLLTSAAPVLADNVSIATGSDGTTIVNGKPCRVVTLHERDRGSASNSTTITTSRNGISGGTTILRGGSENSTTVTTGDNSSSVTVGSGSSSGGEQPHASAGSDCVVYRHVK